MTADLLRLLDELDAAREAGTATPWIKWQAPDVIAIGAGHRMFGGVPSNPATWIASDVAAHNAALIVAAVNALPKLTAALRAVVGLGERFGWDTMREPDWTGQQVAEAIAAALTPEATS